METETAIESGHFAALSAATVTRCGRKLRKTSLQDDQRSTQMKLGLTGLKDKKYLQT